jgi:hypothetical protein
MQNGCQITSMLQCTNLLLFSFPRYHSLVKLVKVLVRQTQCCKHARLIHRHCFVSSLNQNAIENSNSVFEVSFHPGTSVKSERFVTSLISFCLPENLFLLWKILF